MLAVIPIWLRYLAVIVVIGTISAIIYFKTHKKKKNFTFIKVKGFTKRESPLTGVTISFRNITVRINNEDGTYEFFDGDWYLLRTSHINQIKETKEGEVPEITLPTRESRKKKK